MYGVRHLLHGVALSDSVIFLVQDSDIFKGIVSCIIWVKEKAGRRMKLTDYCIKFLMDFLLHFWEHGHV